MVKYLWENVFKKERKQQDVVEILKANYLFALLSRKELRFVKDIVHIRTYRPGEFVFRQGEVGVGMYIVVNGAVDVHVEDLQAEESERTSMLITRLTAGDFFGELSLVEDNGRRTATAVASDETSLIGFFKPDLLEIVDRSPSTGAKIVLRLAQVLGKRLKETTHKVSELKREVKSVSENS